MEEIICERFFENSGRDQGGVTIGIGARSGEHVVLDSNRSGPDDIGFPPSYWVWF